MSSAESHFRQPRISLLEFLHQRGWQPVADDGGDEVAGLCPLHRERRPFYVNRRKQVFYCHGCGRGGGLRQLMDFLAASAWSDDAVARSPHLRESKYAAGYDNLPQREKLLELTYQFYQRHLLHSGTARGYLARRGIHDGGVIEAMRIGYAPGACLRGYLQQLGYGLRVLQESGLVNAQRRDSFFRAITFPLAAAGSLYGRSITNGLCRHRLLPGSKGNLYGCPQAFACGQVIVVEGLFDVAALWQAGFPGAVSALGSHLNPAQLAELCRLTGRRIYICFDADGNGSGQRAARCLAIQLRHAGREARRVELPRGQDPASFFAAGAGAGDFRRCLREAQP